MAVNAIANDYLSNVKLKGSVENEQETNAQKSLFKENKTDATETNTLDKTTTENKPEEETDKKLSFLEGVKSFFGGVKDKVVEQAKNIVNFAKKQPVLAGIGAATAVGVAITSILCPPVAIGVGVAATLYGGYSFIKDIPDIKEAIEDYKNTNSKEEAQKAMRNIGYEGMDAIEDVALMAAGTAQAINGIKAVAAEIAFEDSLYSAGSIRTSQGAQSTAFQRAEIDASASYLRTMELERSSAITSPITAINGILVSDEMIEAGLI